MAKKGKGKKEEKKKKKGMNIYHCNMIFQHMKIQISQILLNFRYKLQIQIFHVCHFLLKYHQIQKLNK